MSTPTEEIKVKIDIIDLVGEYVKLTAAGANWKGRCPFHAEKTPSFMVSRDKQIWHCFGCSEGGDIFTFIQKIEGLDFPDALRLLANRAGVVIKQEDPSIASQRTRLLNLHSLAAQFFHRVLRDSQLAQPARDYLARRGVDDLTVDDWQLGYAPDSWDATSKFLLSKGYTEHEIFLAGLSIRRESASGFYDRFRHRLVFPIRDPHGHVIGFSCRTLDPESKEAKYINTPQTPLFNKGQVLFGLDKAKTDIRQTKDIVVVEGNLDVITSHQFGVKNVVATCGTALTDDHVMLIKRYAPTVILSFDQDPAGQKAAERGIGLALRGGLNVKLLTMPTGEDPDSFIRKNSPAVWRDRIAGAVGVMEYYFQTFVSGVDLNSGEQKKQVVAKLLPVIREIASPVEQNHWLQQLADALNVPESILRETLSRLPKTSVEPRRDAGIAPSQPIVTMESKHLQRLLILLFAWPEELPRVTNQLTEGELLAGPIRALYKDLVIFYNSNHHTLGASPALVNAFTDTLTGDAKVLANQLFFLGGQERELLPAASVTAELSMVIRDIKRHSIHHQLQHLSAALKEAEAAHDQSMVQQLSEQFSKLTDQLRSVSS